MSVLWHRHPLGYYWKSSTRASLVYLKTQRSQGQCLLRSSRGPHLSLKPTTSAFSSHHFTYGQWKWPVPSTSSLPLFNTDHQHIQHQSFASLLQHTRPHATSLGFSTRQHNTLPLSSVHKAHCLHTLTLSHATAHDTHPQQSMSQRCLPQSPLH